MSIEKKKFTVHRAMHGDGRDYARGDVREMTEADAATLVKSGALSPEGDDPLTREPGMRHTFGAEPSKVNEDGYTSATGEGISLPRATAARPRPKPVPPAA